MCCSVSTDILPAPKSQGFRLFAQIREFNTVTKWANNGGFGFKSLHTTCHNIGSSMQKWLRFEEEKAKRMGKAPTQRDTEQPWAEHTKWAYISKSYDECLNSAVDELQNSEMDTPPHSLSM